MSQAVADNPAAPKASVAPERPPAPAESSVPAGGEASPEDLAHLLEGTFDTPEQVSSDPATEPAPASQPAASEASGVTPSAVTADTSAAEVASAAEQAAVEQAPATEPAPGPSVDSAEDLASAVERLRSAEPAAAGPAAVEPPAEAPAVSSVGAASTPEHIESLDQQLAGLADNLIAGEGDGEPDGESTEVAPPRPMVPPPAPVEPKSEPVVAAVAQADAKLRAKEAPRDGVASIVTAQPRGPGAGERLSRRLAAVWGRVSPAALRVCAALSGPLRGKPAAVQTAVGALAIANVVMGAYVWVYVGFLRPTEPPPPPPLVIAKDAAKAPDKDKPKGAEKGKPADKSKAKDKGKDKAKGGGGH